MTIIHQDAPAARRNVGRIEAAYLRVGDTWVRPYADLLITRLVPETTEAALEYGAREVFSGTSSHTFDADELVEAIPADFTAEPAAALRRLADRLDALDQELVYPQDVIRGMNAVADGAERTRAFTALARTLRHTAGYQRWVWHGTVAKRRADVVALVRAAAEGQVAR